MNKDHSAVLAYWSRVLALILFGLVLLYTLGCANPIVAPKSPQEAINEANVYLTATANVIKQNAEDKVYTKDEAQRYLDKVRDLAKQVDNAQALVTAGLPNAKDQAELVRALIIALHREVAARARKP
jgi:soluble cytochrome b562